MTGMICERFSTISTHVMFWVLYEEENMLCLRNVFQSKQN